MVSFDVKFFESSSSLPSTSSQYLAQSAPYVHKKIIATRFDQNIPIVVLWLFRVVQIPKIIRAMPIAKMRKSAGNNKAQTALTVPAIINKKAKKTKAIPAIVVPLILSIVDNDLNLEYK
jgi:hypothetical protein